MPRNVARFERLMYGSLAIGILVLLLDGPRKAASPEIRAAGGMALVIGGAICILALIALFIWLIARRRQNWARWLFAILFLAGLVPFVPGFTDLLHNNLAAAILSATQFVLQITALYCIFTGDARPWFHKRPTTAV